MLVLEITGVKVGVKGQASVDWFFFLVDVGELRTKQVRPQGER